jgi:hypothetical protein
LEIASHPTKLLNPEIEGVAIERLGDGGRVMWISIFAIAIATAIFLSVAAIMMSVKSAKAKPNLTKLPFSLDSWKRVWAN